MFIILEQYHQILKNENMKAAPDKSHFFLTRVKFLGHIIERNTIIPLKSRIHAIQKLQPPTNKKKIQEFLNKIQLCLRPFYNILSGTNKMNLISANSRLFTQAELRLSNLMRECAAIIYTLTEYEFLILGSKHPTVLFTDHKPIIFLFTQKSNPNQRVYRFQLILMKFPNLHIVWTAGKF